jgi:HEAT repeat protein
MSLYELEREGDVEGVSEILTESDNETIRKRAAKILGRLPQRSDRDAVESLLRAATEDGSKEVRVAAVESLGKLEEKNAIADIISNGDKNKNEDIVDLALRGLESDERAVRAASVSLLGSAGGERSLRALGKAPEDPERRVREMVAESLGGVKHPAAVNTLLEMSDDSSARVREKVAEALSEYDDTGKAQGTVVDLSEDPKPQVRRAAASSLGRFGTRSAIEAAAERLGDKAGPVRLSAAFSLVECLSNAPGPKSHEIREFATDVTKEKAVGRETAEALADVLEADQRTARRNAAWLLGRIADPTEPVVDALVESLGDDDEMTSQFAATALGEIGGDKVRQRLIDSVQDEGKREMAVFALGEIGGKEAEKVLSDLVDETESENVREKAFSAISKLDGDPESHI